MTTCTFCPSSEVFYRREQEGVGLCRRCFADSVETKVRRAIASKHMLEPSDTVTVALSGGKDSVTLLRILSRLERRFPLARLTALTVDEGIEGYRSEAISISKEACEELGIELATVSFEELFGIRMDEIAAGQNKMQPCSYCGVLRRRALNEGARRLKATKLATAHNLDDEVQTALLNIIHGDINRITRGSIDARTQTSFVPRIKPLAEVPETETTLYAYATGARFQTIPCPHGHDALRGEIRTVVNRLELKHPGVKNTIYSSVRRLADSTNAGFRTREFRACALCGEPTPNETCEACMMLTTLRSHGSHSHDLLSTSRS